MKNIRKSVLINFIWRVLEKMGTQIITLAVTVILACILAPGEYGIVAIIGIFISILSVFVDSGLGTALIQKKMWMKTIFLQFSSGSWDYVFFSILHYSSQHR